MIALSGADIGPAERQAVSAVLRSGRLALGPRSVEFEQLVARHVGVRHAVAVSSGTAGLHLLVRALGLGPGDEVITTSFSFVASVNCLLYEGVTPVFADIDPDTLCLDPARVEELVTSRTRAILAVDVFGHPADWPALERIARKHHLALIEDSCEALGSSLGSRRCGSFGDAAVFAFYPNKQITTGEGGMVVTRNARIARLCRSMANQGRSSCPGPLATTRWLEHVRLGYNYRMSELAAALGCAQMSRLDRIVNRRRRVARRYDRLLAGVAGVRVPNCRPGVFLSPFVYCVRLAPRLNRSRVMAGLRRQRVECADYFRPIHRQPCFRPLARPPRSLEPSVSRSLEPSVSRSLASELRPSLPVTEAAGRRLVALPFHGRLSPADQQRVVQALNRTLATETLFARRNHAAG